MTYEEALVCHREMLKIDIRKRLHKYNPSKYPDVKSYSVIEAWDVSFTLVFKHPDYKNPFERSSVFYDEIVKKK